MVGIVGKEIQKNFRMDIFKYSPNWSAVERRIKMSLESGETGSTTQKIPASNTRFYYKEESKNKKAEETLCVICKKEKHIPSLCPEKKLEKKETKDPGIYQLDIELNPTTIKLTNLPTDIQRADIKDILVENNITFDSIMMICDKVNRTDFKGIVYLELPTDTLAEKCLSVFDRRKMGVQIVSAMVVETRQRL